MLWYSCIHDNFTTVFKTKYTLYIASGSGPYHRPPPRPPAARLIHISTPFTLGLAPLLSVGMPRQSRFDPVVSTLQADIFFCEVGAQSVGLLPWQPAATREGGTCFRTRLRVYVQPASQPGRIDHFVCPSYHVIGLIKTRSGGNSGETQTLTTCHCGSIRTTNKKQDGVPNLTQWWGGDTLDRPPLVEWVTLAHPPHMLQRHSTCPCFIP